MRPEDGVLATVDAPIPFLRRHAATLVGPAVAGGMVVALPQGLASAAYLAGLGDPALLMVGMVATWGALAVQVGGLAVLELFLLRRVADLDRGAPRPVGETLRAAVTPARLGMRLVALLLVGMGLAVFVVPGLVVAGLLVLSGPMMVVDDERPSRALEASFARMRREPPDGWKASPLARGVALTAGAYLLNAGLAGLTQLPAMVFAYAWMLKDILESAEAGVEALDFGPVGIASGVGAVLSGAASGVAMAYYAVGSVRLRDWVVEAQDGERLLARIRAVGARP